MTEQDNIYKFTAIVQADNAPLTQENVSVRKPIGTTVWCYPKSGYGYGKDGKLIRNLGETDFSNATLVLSDMIEVENYNLSVSFVAKVFVNMN